MKKNYIWLLSLFNFFLSWNKIERHINRVENETKRSKKKRNENVQKVYRERQKKKIKKKTEKIKGKLVRNVAWKELVLEKAHKNNNLL